MHGGRAASQRGDHGLGHLLIAHTQHRVRSRQPCSSQRMLRASVIPVSRHRAKWTQIETGKEEIKEVEESAQCAPGGAGSALSET